MTAPEKLIAGVMELFPGADRRALEYLAQLMEKDRSASPIVTRNTVVDFLYWHGEFTDSHAWYVVDLLADNGFTFHRKVNP